MTDHEIDVDKLLQEFRHLPRFPDGRIDFSQSEKAPVVTCFVRWQHRILLLKRSAAVRTYQGKWGTVAGYIDEPRPVGEKALQELHEELGITSDQVSAVRVGSPYQFFDSEARKTWVVHPVMVELKEKAGLRLDREHTEYAWIRPQEIADYETVPMLDESLRRVTTGR